MKGNLPYFCIRQLINGCLYCRVVKLADTPPCLGGGESGKLTSVD
jgi:hypothetical protein